MKVLSQTEVNQWFATFSNDGDNVQCNDSELFFAHPEASCIDVEYPEKLERLPFLARYLATIGYEAADFRGAMVWFTEWGVWDPLDEAPGYRLVEAMCTAAGQPSSFETGAGYQFRADELEQAIGMLLQPMVFGWDAYFYPTWSYGQNQFFLHVSHDSFATVVTRTKEFFEKSLALLKALELNAMPGHELQVRRFCKVR